MLCRSLLSITRLASSVLRPKPSLYFTQSSSLLRQRTYIASMPPRKAKASSTVGSSKVAQDDKVEVGKTTRGKRSAQKKSYKESDSEDSEAYVEEAPAKKSGKRKPKPRKSDSSSEDEAYSDEAPAKKSTKRKPKSRKADNSSEDEVYSDEAPAKKSTKRKQRQQKSDSSFEDEAYSDEAPAKKSGKRKPKSRKPDSASEDEVDSDEAPAKRSTKRKQRPQKSDSSFEEDDEPKPKRSSKKARPSIASSNKKSKAEKSDAKAESPERAGDEENTANISYEKKGSLKIVSWNVNGLRAWLPKGGLEYLNQEAPDVFCVQETKCPDDKLPKELESLKGYKSYFLAGDKEGYSGVGILSKLEPLKVSYGIDVDKHDTEGRVITMEFEDFYLVNAYVPNAGRGLVRLDYRMQWDEDFRAYLCKLKEKKGVVLTGDLNVAHQEIDLANPKTNKRNAGFTQEERDGMSALLDQGFTDTFRKLYPDRAKAYTFWTYMMNARAKNVGWRLDYFIVSEQILDKVVDNEIRDKVMGSDHCPIVLHIK